MDVGCCCWQGHFRIVSTSVNKVGLKMTSQTGPSGSKAPNIAAFSSEASIALETTQELQDNVHKLLHMFTEWNSHESEESLVRVKEKIKDIQSCQRLGKYLRTIE